MNDDDSKIRLLETPPQTTGVNPPTSPRSEVAAAPTIVLTEEQVLAVQQITAWFESPTGPLEYKLGGYAGTGKTTIIRTIREVLSTTTKVCAFTGKACNVLQRKGINAQTIHSLIYDCFQDPKTKVWTFSLKHRLEANPKLIIVDEASMLSTQLYNDLRSFKIKLLFVGDPGQLEPVGDNPNLMATPDFILSKIHRQAEASPIIKLAADVRTGVGSCLTHKGNPELSDLVIRNKFITPSQLLLASQLICAKNKTRQDFNTAVRAYLRRPPNVLAVEDKVIVLRNNMEHCVFNGQIFFIVSIDEENLECWTCTVKDELGVETTLPIWKRPFRSPPMKKDEYIPRKYVYCDYAYAITCHKSQGSEWDNVIVYDEWMPASVWDMKRWRYTSITRAAKKLTYLI